MPAPDASAIAGLLTSLKVGMDMSKAFLGLRDAQLIDAKAVELTAQIIAAHQSALAAQAAQSELVERERDLRQMLVKMKNWDREKRKYQLEEIASGVFAYATKPGVKTSDPPHKLCANCYNDGRKAILQAFSRSHSNGTTRYLQCQSCKAEMPIETRSPTYSAPSRMMR